MSDGGIPANVSSLGLMLRLSQFACVHELSEPKLAEIKRHLIGMGDFDDALELVRHQLAARIDRAANTANSARQALARNLERLPAVSPQWRATRRMYLATMHREMPAAVRRVVRGQ